MQNDNAFAIVFTLASFVCLRARVVVFTGYKVSNTTPLRQQKGQRFIHATCTCTVHMQMHVAFFAGGACVQGACAQGAFLKFVSIVPSGGSPLWEKFLPELYFPLRRSQLKICQLKICMTVIELSDEGVLSDDNNH